MLAIMCLWHSISNPHFSYLDWWKPNPLTSSVGCKNITRLHGWWLILLLIILKRYFPFTKGIYSWDKCCHYLLSFFGAMANVWIRSSHDALVLSILLKTWLVLHSIYFILYIYIYIYIFLLVVLVPIILHLHFLYSVQYSILFTGLCNFSLPDFYFGRGGGEGYNL